MSPVATQFAERVIVAILTGGLLPGTRLDPVDMDLPRHLAEQVLDNVCACGLAERHPDGDVHVIAPDLSRLLDRFEALGEIVALCASLAARRATGAEVEALDDLVQQMEEAEPPAYRQASLDLYDLVCQMTRNAELCRVCSGLRLPLEAVWPVWPRHADRWQQSMHAHRALAEAIRDRDPEQAAVVMRGQLRAVSREVLFTAGICATDPV